MTSVTRSSNRELFDILVENADFDHDHIPKHGSGNVQVLTEDDKGNKYEADAVWDYNNGIDWTYGYVEFYPVKVHVETCPCCGKPK